MNLPDPTGKTVLILAGEYTGQEGVCLGRAADRLRWAVSPNSSDRIVELEYDQEFGIVVGSDNEVGAN